LRRDTVCCQTKWAGKSNPEARRSLNVNVGLLLRSKVSVCKALKIPYFELLSFVRLRLASSRYLSALSNLIFDKLLVDHKLITEQQFKTVAAFS
jgi:hypothetical protein